MLQTVSRSDQRQRAEMVALVRIAEQRMRISHSVAIASGEVVKGQCVRIYLRWHPLVPSENSLDSHRPERPQSETQINLQKTCIPGMQTYGVEAARAESELRFLLDKRKVSSITQ